MPDFLSFGLGCLFSIFIFCLGDRLTKSVQYSRSSVWRRYVSQLPGPLKWPLIGSLLELKRTELRHEFLTRLMKKYGETYSLGLGPITTIIVNSVSMGKLFFEKNGAAICSRPTLFAPFSHGVVWASGQTHKLHKRLVVNIMAGMKFVENHSAMVNLEIPKLIDDFGEKCGEPTTTVQPFTDFSARTMGRLIFGSDFDHVEKDVDDFTSEMRRHLSMDNKNILNMVVDMLPYRMQTYFEHSLLCRNKSGEKRVRKIMEKIVRYRRAKGGDHRSYNGSKDFAHYFDALMRIEEKGSENVTEELSLHEKIVADDLSQTSTENFSRIVFDLLMAGQETVLGTYQWLVLHLARNSEWQAKLRYESLHKDTDAQDKLPLLNAFVNEVLRVSPAFPTSFPYTSVADVSIPSANGAEVLIPKGSFIIFNSFAALRDPEYFANPDVFDPDRWLNTDGTSLEKSLSNVLAGIAFGIGRRRCPGEGLARTEMVLAISNLVTNFEISFDHKDCVIPSDQETERGMAGLIRCPPEHTVVFKRLTKID